LLVLDVLSLVCYVNISRDRIRFFLFFRFSKNLGNQKP